MTFEPQAPVLTYAEFVACLCTAVQRTASSAGLIVALTGLNAAGKTTLAANLAAALEAAGVTVVVLHVDDFHFPRSYRYQGRLDRQFFERYFDWDTLLGKVLQPLRRDGSLNVVLPLLDLASDQRIERKLVIPPGAVTILEGVFLLRDAVAPYYDRSVYLDASIDTVIGRGIQRWTHLAATEVRRRFVKKYLPGQRQHISADAPVGRADVVVDIEDIDAPTIRDNRWPELVEVCARRFP